MNRFLIFCGLAALLSACANNDTKVKGTAAIASDSTVRAAPAQPKDLPYSPAYTAQWTNEVPDADLKTVLTTYKDWENNNMKGLGSALADSAVVDMWNGDHFKKSNADLVKLWSASRDSLRSVKITMDAWNKMYATNKKEGYIVTWYSETDTYKNGKVDSADYHDINQVKDGKIVWYAQYKRPKK